MKFICLRLLICFLLITSSEGFGQTTCFYNDTIFDINGNIFEIKDTYVRKNVFMRTTVVIHNTSDNFMIIDPEDVFSRTPGGSNLNCLYGKTIVIIPHSLRMFNLKFSTEDFRSSEVYIDFTRIVYSDHIQNTYEFDELPFSRGKKLTVGNLKLEFIDAKWEEGCYQVRLRTYYSGQALLGINFNNIGMNLNGSNTNCYNLKRPMRKFNFSPNRKNEIYTLVFPDKCMAGEYRDHALTFRSVFTEYAVVPGRSFTAKLRLLQGGREDPEQKKDIDLID